MQRVTACIAAALLLVALLIGFLSENATARGAIFEGNVRCERRCSIQDFRIAGEIVPDTLDAVTNLFGELHRQADQQYKAIGGDRSPYQQSRRERKRREEEFLKTSVYSART